MSLYINLQISGNHSKIFHRSCPLPWLNQLSCERSKTESTVSRYHVGHEEVGKCARPRLNSKGQGDSLGLLRSGSEPASLQALILGCERQFGKKYRHHRE